MSGWHKYTCLIKEPVKLLRIVSTGGAEKHHELDGGVHQAFRHHHDLRHPEVKHRLLRNKVFWSEIDFLTLNLSGTFPI